MQIDGKDYSGDAIVSFVSDDGEYTTIIYPEQKSINLSEGQYEIQVSVYKNSSLKIEETATTQCVDIPQSGIGGIIGLTEEKCFDINIPEQIVSNVLSAGGKESYYVLESELMGANTIEINSPGLPTVNSLKTLQENYLLFDDNNLDIEFK